MTERKRGTFVVTHASESSAVLQDTADSQIHTVESPPELEAGDVLEATVEPVPPMNATWRIVEVDEQRTVPIARSAEPPTRQAIEAAAGQDVGELTCIERAGTGELHVITIPDGHADQAVADVLDDETGLTARAARLGVDRVEIRATDGDEDEPGVVSVRYLP